MTRDEQEIALATQCVTFGYGSLNPDKGFAADMRLLAQTDPERPLTAKQRAYLYRIGHRYRVQLGACLCPDCPACNPVEEMQMELFA